MRPMLPIIICDFIHLFSEFSDDHFLLFGTVSVSIFAKFLSANFHVVLEVVVSGEYQRYTLQLKL